MSCYSKEKINQCDYNNICRSHSAKSDRELYRICPSKLSKRELEDLYFALLENNLDLKRSLNGQQDKIRSLSTKVQRMTMAQKTIQSKETKDCCVGTKAIVSEQKETIQELRRINHRLVEKVRQLNMRLCSAKQFSRKASPLSTTGSRCIRCTAGPSTPKKQASSPKTSESGPKNSVSCQNLDRETISMKSVQTETCEEERRNPDLPCDENKCRTATEELKQKIVHLQNELINVHADYSSRISRLETEVSEVRKENLRVRSEREASEQELIQTARHTSDLLKNLRNSEARCAELTTNLAIEKRRVAELKTQLKAASMSERVNKTIEEHLISRNDSNPPSPQEVKASPQNTPFEDVDVDSSPRVQKQKRHSHKKKIISDICACEESPDVVCKKKEKKCLCECPPPDNASMELTFPTLTGQITEIVNNAAFSPVSQDDSKVSKALDDSGYSGPDTSKSPDSQAENLNKINRDSVKKIVELQGQVDTMTISRSPELTADSQNKPSDTDRTSIASTSQININKPAIQPLKKIGNQKSIRMEIGELNELKSSNQKDPSGDDQRENKQETIHGKKQLELIVNPEITSPNELKNKIIMTTNGDGVSNSTAEVENRKNISTREEDTTNKSESLFNSPDTLKNDNQLRNTEVVPTTIEEGKLNKPNPNNSNIIPTNKDHEIQETKSSSDSLKMSENIEQNILKYDKPVEESSSYREMEHKMFSTILKPHMHDKDSDKIAFIGSEYSYNDPERASDKKEACELCAGCAYEKECETKSTDYQKHYEMSEKLDKRTIQTTKCDQHNSLQIPGPMPVNPNNEGRRAYIEKKKFGRRNSKVAKTTATTTRMTGNNNKKNKEAHSKNIVNDVDVSEKPKENSTAPAENLTSDTPIHQTLARTSFAETGEKKDEETLLVKPLSATKRDSLEINRSRLDVAKHEREETMRRRSINDYYLQNDEQITLQSVDLPPYKSDQQGTQIDEKAQYTTQKDTFDQNAGSGATRRSSGVGKRDVSVYRRRSGTLCFRTLPAGRDPRLCYCDHTQPDHCNVSQVKDQDVAAMKPALQATEQGSRSEADTSSKQTRGTSPDNTECEISSMTDLPFERDELSKNLNLSRAISPGEDKATTTYTDSSTSPAPNTNYTLSEGELPAPTARKLSKAPKQDNISSAMADVSSTQKMEAALQAITEELARCKDLLLCQRPQHTQTGAAPQRSAACEEWEEPAQDRLALHRGLAKQSLGDTYAPKCIFTLHIGTVVLSDEAVLSSRNKNLVLTWQFYDQNIAMTRMRAGRVVLFDFSTEYDIKVTEHFLDYMKHEEMPIVICELDKPDEPFASCTLPLRDALLHTNRRADMSLALLAGPRMLSARAANNDAADSLDSGDEMGVIDLWCLLRADGKQLPIINRAIARPSPPKLRLNRHRSWRILQQVDDDDRSNNEYADLDFTVQRTGSDLARNIYKDAECTRHSITRWGSSLYKFPTTVEIDRGAVDARELEQRLAEHARNTTPSYGFPTTIDAVARDTRERQHRMSRISSHTYDPSKYPPARRQSSTQKNTEVPLVPLTPLAPLAPLTPLAPLAPLTPFATTSQQQQQPKMPLEDSERETSEIMVNEVATRIKARGDMKQALQNSSLQTELTRLPKMDEEVMSMPPSSGSLRSIVARMQKNPKQRQEYSRRPSILHDLRRSSLKMTPEFTPARYPIDDGTDSDMYRKYQSANRTEASKKSVTIVPRHLEPNFEQPQKDDNQMKPSWEDERQPHLDITVLWLALNEECEAMIDPHVQRLYVAYSFLGKSGAELETPISLPKPKHYVEKCYFNFKKTFVLRDRDLPILGHMARCRACKTSSQDGKDCIAFSVISEPPEDPLGLESCEDIGFAYLFLGDVLAYSADSSGYTEVVPVRSARGGDSTVCGVLAVRLDGLDIVRRCLLLTDSQRDTVDWS